LETLYGLAGSDWKIDNGKFTLNVIIPPNTTALVKLPNAEKDQVTESGIVLKEVKGIDGLTAKGNDVELKLGSGRYKFEYALKM